MDQLRTARKPSSRAGDENPLIAAQYAKLLQSKPTTPRLQAPPTAAPASRGDEKQPARMQHAGSQHAGDGPDAATIAAWQADPDVQRMLRARDGDSQAFQELFLKHSDPLLNFAFRFVGNRARAEEIVQEAFLQIYRARERYQAQARFFTYACRVVTNLCVNELRRLEHRCRIEPLDGGEDGSDAGYRELPDGQSVTGEEAVAGAELAAKLSQVLAALPERRRAALLLSRVDGLSQREVAWVLKTSESAVKSLVFRAMTTLREELRDFLGEI